MKKGKLALVLALATVTAAASVSGAFGLPDVSASANSAPPYWEGSTPSGVGVTGGPCPVEVQHERLTFEIPSLPEAYIEYYDASVTAEYTFYNPTEMDISADLVFPFGARPAYLEDWQFEDRFGVTVDGEEAACEVRYTYTYMQEDFTLSEIDLLSDTRREGTFFREDTAIQAYAIEPMVGLSKYEGAMYEITCHFNPTRTRILISPTGNLFRYDERDGNLVVWMSADGTGVFAIAGEAPDLLETAVVAGAWTYRSEREEICSAELIPYDPCTFAEFAEAARLPQVSEVDWFNAELDYFEKRSGSLGCVYAFPESLDETQLMRWFAYSIEISAGGTLENTVTAPLYPTIDYNEYIFTYLLSPASLWADFGTLEIIVNTPLEITDSSVDFEKAENGYVYTREGLPIGELRFSIYGDPFSERGTSIYEAILIIFIVLTGAAIFLLVSPVTSWSVTFVLAIVLICLFGNKKPAQPLTVKRKPKTRALPPAQKPAEKEPSEPEDSAEDPAEDPAENPAEEPADAPSEESATDTPPEDSDGGFDPQQ